MEPASASDDFESKSRMIADQIKIMLAKQIRRRDASPSSPRRWSRLPRKRGRRRCSGSPASSRPRASTALSPSAPGPPPPLSHTLFSLDFLVILFDFWGAELASSDPAQRFDYLFVSITLWISGWMQLEGTIHQDCTVLPAERAYLPGEVPSFVIDFDSRLIFFFGYFGVW